MIPLSDVSWQAQSWQWHLANAVTDIDQLVDFLELDGEFSQYSDFPLMVPWPWLHRMARSDCRDPLLLQVLPRVQETMSDPGYAPDALQEAGQSPRRGIIHKYQGRVLAIVSGACAINCRYCFRRHFPYGDFQPDSDDWQALFDYVAGNDVSEVILSGGDPLVLNDRRLAWITSKLAAIPDVTTLRIHTRLPVVIPQRVCTALLNWIKATPLRVVVVIHVNHPGELDATTADAMKKLADAGALLLNQSVLLRDVNDDPEILARLSHGLFEQGVLPYYVHLPDKVTGTGHFDVPEQEARAIFRALAGRLPGYLVPRLVREEPGEISKIALAF